MSRLELVTALTSLVVSTAALLLAYRAWTLPFPADPTRVPSWGVGDVQRQTIDGPTEVHELARFVEENAGRKVRIKLDLEPAYFDRPAAAGTAPDQDGFVVPSQACQDMQLSDLTDEKLGAIDCVKVAIELQDVGGDRAGLYLQHGRWQLNGYFASLGYVGTFTGSEVYSLTPLTAIEAVQ